VLAEDSPLGPGDVMALTTKGEEKDGDEGGGQKTPMEEAMEGSVMDSGKDATEQEQQSEAESSTISSGPSPSAEIPSSPVDGSSTSTTTAVEPQPPTPSSTVVPSGGGSSGADLLLPIIIYSVVKSNPSQLVSHLLYIQRYRAASCFSGEASYALVNVTAVVEFLENVELESLGLGGKEKRFVFFNRFRIRSFHPVADE
jgi:hypothetical protein